MRRSSSRPKFRATSPTLRTGTIITDDVADLSSAVTARCNTGEPFAALVELFNRGTTAVDFAVTPYSIQYATSAATWGTGNGTRLINDGTLLPEEISGRVDARNRVELTADNTDTAKPS